jgi:hypothetical protein
MMRNDGESGLTPSKWLWDAEQGVLVGRLKLSSPSTNGGRSQEKTQFTSGWSLFTAAHDPPMRRLAVRVAASRHTVTDRQDGFMLLLL